MKNYIVIFKLTNGNTMPFLTKAKNDFDLEKKINKYARVCKFKEEYEKIIAELELKEPTCSSVFSLGLNCSDYKKNVSVFSGIGIGWSGGTRPL